MKTTQPVLVVYYSLTGTTDRIARDLATRLGAPLERIEEHDKRSGFLGPLVAAFGAVRERPSQLKELRHDPAKYALTIIGTPIWAGRMTPAVRAYLNLMRDRLNDVAFFTTSGSVGPERVVAALERLTRRTAVAFTGINQRELNTPVDYDRKMAAFLAKVQGTEAAANLRTEPEHASP